MDVRVTRTAPDAVDQRRRFDQRSALWIGISVVIAVLAVLIVAVFIFGESFTSIYHPQPKASVIPQPRVPPNAPVPAVPSTLP